jgi:aldehyde dehydrogenase (NAD+)
MHLLVENQRQYFLEGKTLPVNIRKANLRKLLSVLLNNEKFLAEAIYKDFRKSFYVTVENELCIPYGEINRALRKLSKWSSPKRCRTDPVNFPASSRSVPVPYGVALVIGPWNYPYMLNLVPVISALAAGNTVILKPSELAPNSSSALSELINTNFPPELLHVVEGGVEGTGVLLKERFDKIFFTGSSAVGKIIMKAAANHLTPVTLELGGKNPVIVMPDCNLRIAAQRIIWGKCHNNGQTCVSPDHVYVHREIEEELLNEMKKAAEKIHRNDPLNCTILPRIINENHFDRLRGMIDGNRVVFGGKHDRKELFIEPTVLRDVKEGDAVMREEIFGPILPVLEFDKIETLINNIRQRPTPLILYIFTGSRKMAGRIMKAIPSGGVSINDTVMQFVNINIPLGGLGESGMGSYHGRAGFDAFTHYQSVMKKPTWFELSIKYPPYKSYRLKLLRVFLGRSIRGFWQ